MTLNGGIPHACHIDDLLNLGHTDCYADGSTVLARNSQDVSLSKSLSWILRHGAKKEGLNISPEGYIPVPEILQHRSFIGHCSLSDIERIVENNGKQRFKLRRNPGTGIDEIKANQGHSIDSVTNDGLIKLIEPKYETVVHGTYFKCWESIKKQGLSRMNRKHIHLAKGTLSDKNIKSGIRSDCQIYIFIDLKKALTGGLQFFESENGVILTSGNDNGFLSPDFFKKALTIKDGCELKF